MAVDTSFDFDYARTWAEHDPDADTARQVLTWIEENNSEELAAAFAGPLNFGTAGLRAAVGAGESRMNRAVVIRTTYGLITWLKQQVNTPVVVIGCDARHGSAQFQRDAAQVISAAGGKALVLPAQNPTPLTAFTVRSLGADAGIMVTASHNPPADNGYKVYLGGRVATGPDEGVQLISPADKEIAAAIAKAPYADEVPLTSDHIEDVDTRAEYLDRTAALVGDNTDITIALTAMHGVGAELGKELLSRCGFTVSLVPEQAAPDPDFPTVSFPNPEEPGALDLGIQHAEKIGADILIAYDPTPIAAQPLCLPMAPGASSVAMKPVPCLVITSPAAALPVTSPTPSYRPACSGASPRTTASATRKP